MKRDKIPLSILTGHIEVAATFLTRGGDPCHALFFLFHQALRACDRQHLITRRVHWFVKSHIVDDFDSLKRNIELPHAKPFA